MNHSALLARTLSGGRCANFTEVPHCMVPFFVASCCRVKDILMYAALRWVLGRQCDVRNGLHLGSTSHIHCWHQLHDLLLFVAAHWQTSSDAAVKKTVEQMSPQHWV